MIRALGMALVHFAWQGAAVAALLAGLDLALRGASLALATWPRAPRSS
jgi:ABC-type molybdate transport system permease subunit